jgi:putative hydrolase of the HAD superfamily
MTQDFFQGVFNDCLTGKADLEQVLPPFLKDWGWKASAGEFISSWLHYDHVVDEQLINAILDLRRKGIICCLATNQEWNRARYMKTGMDFQTDFDHLFFSYEIGCQKPDLKFYRCVQEMLKFNAETILFWDDNQVNVDAARQCGWLSEIYIGFNAFKCTVTKYINR